MYRQVDKNPSEKSPFRMLIFKGLQALILPGQKVLFLGIKKRAASSKLPRYHHLNGLKRGSPFQSYLMDSRTTQQPALRPKYNRPDGALDHIEASFPQLPGRGLLCPVLVDAYRQLGDALVATRREGEFEGSVHEHVHRRAGRVFKTPTAEVVYFTIRQGRIFFLAGYYRQC